MVSELLTRLFMNAVVKSFESHHPLAPCLCISIGD